jgi:hypothetical protein
MVTKKIYRKNTSKKLSKKLSKKKFKKLSKNKSKKLSKKIKTKGSTLIRKTYKKTLKGSGTGMSRPPGEDSRYHIGSSPCFAFYDLRRMIKVAEYLTKCKTVTTTASPGEFNKFINTHRNNIDLFVQILNRMSTDEMVRSIRSFPGRTDYDVNQVAIMLEVFQVVMLNQINNKRTLAKLGSITERSNEDITSAPFKYNDLEDNWVNAIRNPAHTKC